MAEKCSCYNPVLLYLAETLLNDDVIRQVSDAMGKAGDLKCQPAVSVMYTGGVIRPMKNGAVDQVDAIGFHDGKVVAAGSKSEVTARMNGLTYITIELPDGQALLPGLIEPHVHIVPTAMMMAWNDFGPFAGQCLREKYDSDWLESEIKKADGALLLEQSWILAQGVDPSLMPFTLAADGGLNELQSLNCDVLDKMGVDRPVMIISASGHTAYVNTAALDKIYQSSASIREKYPNFSDYRAHVLQQGGLQEIVEMVPGILAIPFWQKIEVVLGIKKHFDILFETASQRGVTLMYDAGMTSLFKILLDLYLLAVKARVRIGYAELCDSLKAAEKLAPYIPPTTEFKNVYQGNVKLVSDGSNQGLTGYQTESYCCKPEDNKGIFNFPPLSTYLSIVKTVAAKGWPLMIHANGNKAIDYAIAAYKEALGGATGQTKRHRIEHCSLLSQGALDEICALGVSPSFLIGHVGYWGYVFKSAIFEGKAEELDLCKSALDKGMRITLHSDNFVTPLGPLRMMEQAITRIMEQDPHKNVLNESEKISAEQALKTVTYDAAWQCHADGWVGSLEEDKMADYVILAGDPITHPAVGMRDIPVLETWVGGVRMH